jgi:hypothetical protein
MRTVHRYKLDHGTNRIEVPTGWKFLSTGVRPGDLEPSIWLEVPANPVDAGDVLSVRFVGTGFVVPEHAVEFLGSVIAPTDMPLVWHVYRVSA